MSKAAQDFAAESLKPFDPAAALNRLDGDEELLREVVGLVEAEWLHQSEAIESAIRRSEIAAIAAAAHALKAAIGQLFSPGHAEGIAGVERAARAGDLVTAEAAWRVAELQIPAFLAAARRWAAC